MCAEQLTSGDLPFVPESGLRIGQTVLTGRQKGPVKGAPVRTGCYRQQRRRACIATRYTPFPRRAGVKSLAVAWKRERRWLRRSLRGWGRAGVGASLM